jgi:hypothetical protein
MKKSLILMLITAALSLPASAQRINVDLPEFRALRDKASEEVTVTLDARMLRLASKFLSDDDSDQRVARDIVQKLEGIYVRSYEFDHEGEYDRGLVDRVRSQLGTDWNKIVDVRSKSRENAEIYAYTRGEAITGLVIITAEPKELTIVNIVGPIDLDRLSSLDGQFGIPRSKRLVKESKP